MSNATDLYKQYQTGIQKYIYFLLTASGAAIAFVIEKIQGQVLSIWLLPVGLAILCWGLSFYFGCQSIKNTQEAIRTNLIYLKMPNRSTLNQARQNCLRNFQSTTIYDEYEDELKKTENTIEQLSSSGGKYSLRQFKFLIAGSFFFFLWRILEMVQLTYFL